MCLLLLHFRLSVLVILHRSFCRLTASKLTGITLITACSV
ncbi:Uncharacterised protein [Vibrio cholerae]|nr:Uncharacterised protein [Vibrio cholerae]